jgi:molecular chaperone DnaK
LTEHDLFAAQYRTTRHPVIGVDLGTTTCVAALAGDDGRVIVLPPLAAVVGQDQAGQVTVGRLTVGRRSVGETGAVIAGIKRELGSNRRIRFRGREYQPHELCAYLLIELKRRAEALIGEPVHEAVITVPTTYAETQRKAITEAAGLAQLTVRVLLEEPVAAAFGAERAGTFAIYDLGGGTFDAAIVEAGPDGVTVLGMAGDPRLGGDDFDERVVGYALRQIRERYHVDLSQDDRIRDRIRAEAEIRKRELDTAETTSLELPRLTATVNASVQLPRRVFESMIEPDLDRTFDCLGAAARAAGGAPVDEVLLVGGSTRMPLIRQRLAEHLGLDPARIRSDLDPEELVARGAAMIARGLPPASLEVGPIGLRSANLRLRSEMAVPESEPTAESPDADLAGTLPAPPAETPADFRPAAQQAHDMLAQAPPDELSSLRAAYCAFLVAIRLADPDARLNELGAALTAELATLDPAP